VSCSTKKKSSNKNRRTLSFRRRDRQEGRTVKEEEEDGICFPFTHAEGQGNESDQEEELPGCMICLDPMSKADLAHPLMCSSIGCCFNFCVTCIESLTEQRDQHGIGSNTIRRNHILLHCPNCRSDLGPFICDTVLLRKVDGIASSDMFSNDDPDDEKVQNQLALKKAMDVDVTLLREIAQARDREAQFFERKFARLPEDPPAKEEDSLVSSALATIITPRRKNTSDANSNWRKKSRSNVMTFISAENEHRDEICGDEEWGFEVDIRVGAHESIKLPNEMFPYSVFQTNEFKADRTLLGGLECALSQEEQEQLTRSMISGDTYQLAKAAEILSTVAESIHLCSSSSLISESDEKSPSLMTAATKHTSLRRSSIYHWVETGKRARSSISTTRDALSRQGSPSTSYDTCDIPVYHHNYNAYTKLHAIKATEHRLIERQLREKLAYMRRHPLPVRMPKYAEFTVNFDQSPGDLETSQIVKKLPVRFCNDTWDGTVMDAFSKIYVTPRAGGAHPSRGCYVTGKNYAQPFRPRPTSTFVDNYSVFHKRQETPGIRNILQSDDGIGIRIDTPHPRVLIAAVVDSQASQQGVLKGDVVTHVNGVELRDAHVDDLVALICSLLYHPTSSNRRSVAATNDECTPSTTARTTLTLQLVLNADRATAAALKMRAVAPDH